MNNNLKNFSLKLLESFEVNPIVKLNNELGEDIGEITNLYVDENGNIKGDTKVFEKENKIVDVMLYRNIK